MAEKKKYNSILVSGRKDETLSYSKYIKDEESGESVKESLDKKVNVTDKLETQQIKDGAITNEKMADGSVGNTNLQDGSVSNEKLEDGSITNEKLAENSITKDKLKDNTIRVEKLDPELRQTINAATGLPEITSYSFILSGSRTTSLYPALRLGRPSSSNIRSSPFTTTLFFNVSIQY